MEVSLIVFGPVPNIRSVYHGGFSIAMVEAVMVLLHPFCNADVPETLADMDVNRRDTDASRSDKFWVLRYVRFFVDPSSFFS
jgi:hypothetical protein